jgi:hypothetical protein
MNCASRFFLTNLARGLPHDRLITTSVPDSTTLKNAIFGGKEGMQRVFLTARKTLSHDKK